MYKTYLRACNLILVHSLCSNITAWRKKCGTSMSISASYITELILNNIVKHLFNFHLK